MTPKIVQYNGFNWKDVWRASIKINEEQPSILHILSRPVQYLKWELQSPEQRSCKIRIAKGINTRIRFSQNDKMLFMNTKKRFNGQLRKFVHNNNLMQNIRGCSCSDVQNLIVPVKYKFHKNATKL